MSQLDINNADEILDKLNTQDEKSSINEYNEDDIKPKRRLSDLQSSHWTNTRANERFIKPMIKVKKKDKHKYKKKRSSS